RAAEASVKGQNQENQTYHFNARRASVGRSSRFVDVVGFLQFNRAPAEFATRYLKCVFFLSKKTALQSAAACQIQAACRRHLSTSEA
ncbi:unnamed protein product, partial [Amoebophrya sp. A25]